MKQLTNIIFITGLILMIPIVSITQTDISKFDNIVKEHFKNMQGPGLSIQISQEGETIYSKAVGKANLEHDIEMESKHVFRIGSITKQFTASAILRLSEQGQLDLKDDITKFISDYPTHGHKITIEHLLTHTSGIKSYTGMESFRAMQTQDMTPMELINVFKDEPMDFDPGEDYRYNNSGYILLGYIIEKISGMSYGEYLDKEFFKPLGMVNSYYGDVSKIVNNRANGYRPTENGFINAPYLSMTLPYAAGSILSTVDDLSIWYHAVMNGEVLNAASLKLAHTPYKLNDGSDRGYGYGWSISDIQESPAIGHGGGINGFQTESIYFLEEKVFVTVFTNCNCNDTGSLIDKLAAQAIGKPILLPEAVDVSDELIEEYEGFYELRPFLILRLRYSDGKFYIKPTEQRESEVIPVADHKFYAQVIDSYIDMNSNDKGEVESLTLHQGAPIPGPKIQFGQIDVDLNKYVGTYMLESGDPIEIKYANSILIGEAFNTINELTGINNTTFLAKDDVVKLEFKLDAEGSVESLILYMGGAQVAKKKAR